MIRRPGQGMVRKDTHETRIEEVRQALASLQKIQAELALRHPSTELAVCEGNSRELVVDERREQRTSSSLGGGVVVLLVLVAGAAGLVSYGPIKVPDWAKTLRWVFGRWEIQRGAAAAAPRYRRSSIPTATIDAGRRPGCGSNSGRYRPDRGYKPRDGAAV